MLGLGCSTWDLQSSLQLVRSSSLTRDGNWAPCIGSPESLSSSLNHRSPLLQYSCLENSMDIGAWRATKGLQRRRTRLSGWAHWTHWTQPSPALDAIENEDEGLWSPVAWVEMAASLPSHRRTHAPLWKVISRCLETECPSHPGSFCLDHILQA